MKKYEKEDRETIHRFHRAGWKEPTAQSSRWDVVGLLHALQVPQISPGKTGGIGLI